MNNRKIYISENGLPSAIVLEYHLVHWNTDIPPRLCAAIALMDAALGDGGGYSSVVARGNHFTVMPGVGCRWISDNVFEYDVYFVKRSFVEGTGE